MTSRAGTHPSFGRALLLSTALGLATTQAAAQSPAADPAADAYSQGAALAAEGRWEEARAKFEQAVAARATPIGLFNLAQAERNLGMLTAAKRHFRSARALAKRDAADDVARLADDALAEMNPRVPKLVLKLPEDAARITVKVDGRPVELVENEVEVDPGKRRVEISAAGERTFVREVEVAEGTRSSLEVRFPRDAAAPANVAPVPEARPQPEGERAGLPVGPIVLGGVGVAALVVGAVFHNRRNQKLDDAAEGCVRTGSGWRCPTALEDDPTHNELRDAADSAETWRNVSFGVGGAALIGAGLWWALGSGSERSPAQVALAVQPGPRATTARVRVRF